MILGARRRVWVLEAHGEEFCPPHFTRARLCSLTLCCVNYCNPVVQLELRSQFTPNTHLNSGLHTLLQDVFPVHGIAFSEILRAHGVR